MLNLLVPAAYAAGSASSAKGGGEMMSLLFPIALIAIFYFLLIRPQMKRSKDQRKMTEALSRGDEVIITGGLAGRIVQVGEVYLTLEIADGVNVKAQKASVNTLLPKGTLKEL